MVHLIIWKVITEVSINCGSAIALHKGNVPGSLRLPCAGVVKIF